MNKHQRKSLAALLSVKRAARGLSIRELGRRAGVNAKTVMLLEQGKIESPRVETVSALATALRLPLVDIHAATNWLPSGELPSLRPYMRAKYDALTEDELAQVETFVDELSRGHAGPRPGEDEQ